MKLFEYDFDDLARQLQQGLERIAVNYLRAHGARIRQDAVDFHGVERIDLELSFADRTLSVHQVGRPRGPGADSDAPLPAGVEAAFESTFDGLPTANQPLDALARWLASLPAGEAPAEKRAQAADPGNPFVVERRPTRGEQPAEPALNPFLTDRPAAGGGRNPFTDDDRDRRRQDALRWLNDDD